MLLQFIYMLSFILSHLNCASLQIILWMLKQKREMIDIMFKINLFFPSRLPQYQNQCVSWFNITGLQVLILFVHCFKIQLAFVFDC